MVGTKDWYEIMAPRYKCSYAGKLSLRHPYHFCIQMLFVRFLRPYYERLRAAAKSGKVAVLAAMRKLLVAEWSVATHRRPFVSIRPTPKVVNHA